VSVPKSHPRYLSLRTRDIIVRGVEKGVTSVHGLLAHGRGEAFDYMIGEKTTAKARKQIKRAAKLLLKAKNPVISVNGNVAALCAREIVELSKIIPAKLEVNIFHKSKNSKEFLGYENLKNFHKSRKREQNIRRWLIKHGAKEVLMPGKGIVKYIEHNRRFCNPDGIAKADVVFVPLEDGDRCEALIKMGKKVITIDLNAKSRTAKFATITIVDNITRALPLLIKEIKNPH